MIHVFSDEETCDVWTDCDEDHQTGRCVGTGPTKREALIDARRELQGDLKQIEDLLTKETK